MSYVALYRKARPPVFDEVKGQDHVVKTLRNQVITERLQHAYLFCGTRGTGKTSVAKILAKAVNCEHPQNGSPCNECASCRAIQAGSSMNVIEIDAASNNGVDNIREIVEEVRYRPAKGRYKVYIIDEVHMLSSGAFNALLKTLEEPPSYVIFILATTEAGRIPVTILSRCQRYDFRRIDSAVIVDRMRELIAREGVSAEEKALRFVARAADGSMRDALSLLDRCIAFYMGEELTYEKVLRALGAVDTDIYTELFLELLEGNAGRAVFIFGKMVESGREIGQFVNDFIWYLRNLLLITASSEEAEEIVDVPKEQRKAMEELAEKVNPDLIMRFIRVLSELQNALRAASNRRVLTEVALVKLARPQMEKTEDGLLDRLRQLENKLSELEMKGVRIKAAEPAGPEMPPEREMKTQPDLPARSPAPGELVKAAEQWNRILAALDADEPLAEAQLRSSVPAYNTEKEEPVLYLKAPSPNAALWDDIFFKSGRAEKLEGALRAAIRKTLGFEVEVRIMRSDESFGHPGGISVEEILKRKIAMEVETEDDIF
ncbi:MAG: DNA polymerase III subunit gamma/tau [Lachnospiraceae bacterium]|nr:DNA polymerase III subunit gamma/tau [Lachnospiraceae bacterium]